MKMALDFKTVGQNNNIKEIKDKNKIPSL